MRLGTKLCNRYHSAIIPGPIRLNSTTISREMGVVTMVTLASARNQFDVACVRVVNSSALSQRAFISNILHSGRRASRRGELEELSRLSRRLVLASEPGRARLRRSRATSGDLSPIVDRRRTTRCASAILTTANVCGIYAARFGGQS